MTTLGMKCQPSVLPMWDASQLYSGKWQGIADMVQAKSKALYEQYSMHLEYAPQKGLLSDVNAEQAQMCNMNSVLLVHKLLLPRGPESTGH